MRCGHSQRERVDPFAVLGATVRRGNFLGFISHAHILVTDGCFFSNKGMFLVAPPWNGSPPYVLIYQTGISTWRGTKDYVMLSISDFSTTGNHHVN